jgi:hypothetical protein
MIIQYMKGEVREKVLIFIWRVISHAKLILNVVYKLNFYIIKECDNYTITNWRVSLSKICHEWPNNTVTQECVQRMSELQCYLVMSYSIYYIDKKKKCFESNLILNEFNCTILGV